MLWGMAYVPVSVDQSLAALDELPPFPRAVVELEECLANPNCDARDLARVVERDPSLASRVMKMANSAFYSVPGGVASVERAVLAMGFSTIHQVAICLQSYGILRRSGHPVPQSFIEHAQAVAALSRFIALRTRSAPPDVAFTAGLLHDLGRVALFSLFPDHGRSYLDAVNQTGNDDVSLEKERIGVDHQWVGSELAKKWRFPVSLGRVVGTHHAEQKQGVAALPLIEVVSAADYWAHQLGRADVSGPAEGSTPPPGCVRLGVESLDEKGRAEFVNAIETSGSLAPIS